MDSEMEKMFISLVTDITFLASSTDWNSEVASLFNKIFRVYASKSDDRRRISHLFIQLRSLNPKLEFLSLERQIENLMGYKKLSTVWTVVVYYITRIIYLVRLMDLDSESELISLINQIISLFNSKPDSESELVSLITQIMLLSNSAHTDPEQTQESTILSFISQLVPLEPELTPLIRQIISHFRAMNWEPRHFISIYPQAELEREQGKLRVIAEDVQPMEPAKGRCRFIAIIFWRYTTEIHFHCRDCNGKNHQEYDKIPVEVKHPLHPKHSVKLVKLVGPDETRECYCCNENIEEMFYYCSVCDYAMTIDCVKKPPRDLSIDHPKWHEHTLALFPSQTSYPCSLCALTHSSCPLYICPPCDFVVHQKCLSLPRVIKISRHPQHRISFTHSFDQGDRLICGICRKKIDNDYGGYSCFKDGCSYKAHSKCATQSNVWDGEDLEGVPEEIEEVLEPFVRISDGIIQHFSHQQHFLRLDKNEGKDYDDNKICEACITPFYYGNFYSCMECEFFIHEKCANLSRKLHIPTHPHRLNLVGIYEGVVQYTLRYCWACRSMCTCGFFYECSKEECSGLKMHVQCATISEPLVHESHIHPLFLTSKPGEKRDCSVCKFNMETFNCAEDECGFALCFECAVVPQKLRYKHDKHMLTLSYGEKTSTMTYWCEVCEGKVNPRERYYKCDEYCCVTIHIECLIGKDLYMKPGSTLFFGDLEIVVCGIKSKSGDHCCC